MTRKLARRLHHLTVLATALAYALLAVGSGFLHCDAPPAGETGSHAAHAVFACASATPRAHYHASQVTDHEECLGCLWASHSRLGLALTQTPLATTNRLAAVALPPVPAAVSTALACRAIRAPPQL